MSNSPQSNPVVESRLIYQFGNPPDNSFIFYKGGFKKTLSKGVKQVIETSSFIDGDVDLRLASDANVSSASLELEQKAQFNSVYSLNYIRNIFSGKRKYAFFFDFETSTTFDIQRNLSKFYFNPFVRSLSLSDVVEDERDNWFKAEREESTTLFMPIPFFYDCTEDVEYISFADYAGNQEIWDSTGVQTRWNSTNQYWLYPPGSFDYVSNLTNAQKLQFFTSVYPDSASINYYLQLRDRFFARDTTQTNRNYVLNNTYSASTQTDTTLTDLFQSVSSNRSLYRVEISELGAGQSCELKNLANNSGIKITWLSGSTSPSDLVFNSYYGKLYSGSSETEIEQALYSVESTGDTPLYFTGLENPQAVFVISNETIRVTLTAGSSPDIKIDVLAAYD